MQILSLFTFPNRTSHFRPLNVNTQLYLQFDYFLKSLENKMVKVFERDREIEN